MKGKQQLVYETDYEFISSEQVQISLSDASDNPSSGINPDLVNIRISGK